MAKSFITIGSRKYETVGDIVRDKLCHSCGVCYSVCPKQAIDFDSSSLPVVSSACNTCGLCLRVCSGISEDSLDLPDGARGEKCFLCASTNPDLRLNSSSGGFVTELFRYLLKIGYVKGVVVTIADPDDPVRPVSILARTEDELFGSNQSRYCLFPWGRILKKVADADIPFAVVGTGCQIRSFRKLMKVQPKLQRNAKLIVGICCESNIEQEATGHLLSVRSVNPSEINKIEYRSGKWPGVMAAFLKDGRQVVLSNRNRVEGAINYLKLTYGRRRCHFCCDVLSEFADVTVGDPWGRNEKGELAYRHEQGFSAVLVKNPEIVPLVEFMYKESIITVEEKEASILLSLQKSQARKGKGRVARRVNYSKKTGKPFPVLKLLDDSEQRTLSLAERMSDIIFQFCHTPLFRKCFLGLMFSPLGDFFTIANSQRKKFCYRLKN